MVWCWLASRAASKASTWPLNLALSCLVSLVASICFASSPSHSSTSYISHTRSEKKNGRNWAAQQKVFSVLLLLVFSPWFINALSYLQQPFKGLEETKQQKQVKSLLS